MVGGAHKALVAELNGQGLNFPTEISPFPSLEQLLREGQTLYRVLFGDL